MQAVENPELRSSLRRFFRQNDPALQAIFERAVDEHALSLSQEWETMRFIELVVRSTYGPMVYWKDINVPPFLQRLAERPYFSMACLRSELASIEGAANTTKQHRIARDAEFKIIENALGMSKVKDEETRIDIENRADEFRRAIEMRTYIRDEKGKLLALSEGGGIDIGAWSKAMKRYVEHVTYFGPDRIKTLREDWSLVDLDRYSRVQLERMVLLSEGDPALLERLRNGELTFVLSTAYGDGNNGVAGDIEALESDTTLFAEVTDPNGLYLPLVRLFKRFGIKPSTLAVTTHSNVGYQGFGIKGDSDYFEIGLTDLADPELSYGLDSFHDIGDSNVGTFLHRYMQPDRKTGKRFVVFLGCFQALRSKVRKLSTPEVLLAATDPADKVVVTASDGAIVWRKDRVLWDGSKNRPAAVYLFWLTASSTIQVVPTDSIIPKVKR